PLPRERLHRPRDGGDALPGRVHPPHANAQQVLAAVTARPPQVRRSDSPRLEEPLQPRRQRRRRLCVAGRGGPHGRLRHKGGGRHPISARVLQTTMAQTALTRGDERTMALRETRSELLKMDDARKRYAAMMSGLDIHYDLGTGHPLLGRRMPDLDLVTENGLRRVFTLLHDARPVLLNLGEPGALDIAPWADRVRQVDARYAGAWELPVLGAVAARTAVLIRPDGHVAWVGDGTDQGLRDALTTWFGPPTAG